MVVNHPVVLGEINLEKGLRLNRSLEYNQRPDEIGLVACPPRNVPSRIRETGAVSDQSLDRDIPAADRREDPLKSSEVALRLASRVVSLGENPGP
jgi:hypothetical protein